MKKLLLCCIALILIVGAVCFSYIESKGQAQIVANSFPGKLSPLTTNLVLFGVPELTPCWVFSAEYDSAYTGATFDVYVSFLGEVIKIPPKSKMPS